MKISFRSVIGLFAILSGLAFVQGAEASAGKCINSHGFVQHTKLLFVIDKSGSNISTDPQGRRADALEEIHKSMKSKQCVKWGVIEFRDPGTKSLTNLSGMPAFVSGTNSQIRRAVRTLRTEEEMGGTPFRAALSLSRLTIENDLERFPDQLNKYRVLIVSDGAPTDGLRAQELVSYTKEILGRAPGRVKISAGFYGISNPAAENFLEELAILGEGKYVNYNQSESLDYQELIIP